MIKYSVMIYIRGYNIGLRLIEEFLARTNLPRCQDFKETGEIIAKVWIFIMSFAYVRLDSKCF